MSTRDPFSWLPRLIGPVGLEGASVGAVIRIGPDGTYVAEPGIELPDALASGDVMFFDGTAMKVVAGPKTNGYVISLVNGVPTWTAGGTGGGGTGSTGGGSVAALNPDTFAWDGAWGPAYTAAPWVGKETPSTSTGTVSGGRSAPATVSTPAAGTINGLSVPSFNGSNTDLDPSGTLGDYITHATGVCSGFVVFNATAAWTDDPINFYVNPPIIGEAAGVWGIGFSTAGFGFSFATAAGQKRAVAPCPVATAKVGLFRYDGVNIEVSVDGGATWVTEPATWAVDTVYAMGRTPYIGRGNASNFNGLIGEVYIRKALLTRDQLAGMATNRKTKFGIT